jgi:hypothetical protein
VINAVNEPLNMGCSRAWGVCSIGDAPLCLERRTTP